MSRRTTHNPERRAWRGRSYKKGGERITTLAHTTTTTGQRTGVRNCACRDCFELTYASTAPALCHDCTAAGCDPTKECQSPDAYEVTQ